MSVTSPDCEEPPSSVQATTTLEKEVTSNMIRATQVTVYIFFKKNPFPFILPRFEVMYVKYVSISLFYFIR